MTTRFKLAAAMLGFAIATAAIGDASANTIIKTGPSHGTGKAIHAATTKVIVLKPRHHVGARIVRHVRLIDRLRIVHRAPVRARLVKVVAAKALVRVIKRPLLRRQSLARTTIVKKTVVR